MKWSVSLKSLIPVLGESVVEAMRTMLPEAMLAPEAVEVKRVESIAARPAERKGGDLGADISAFLSTPHLDRDNDVILPEGLDTRVWMQTGAILEAHNYSKPPVGKAVAVETSGNGLRADIAWAPTEAGQTYRALSMFMPVQFSVGMMKVDAMRRDHPDWAKTLEGLVLRWSHLKDERDNIERVIRRAVMIEASVCPVPSNPQAIQQAVRKALDEHVLDPKNVEFVAKSLAMPDLLEQKPDPDMPGGSFTACVAIMENRGYTEEQAKRICGKLQAESGGKFYDLLAQPDAPPPAPVKAMRVVRANLIASSPTDEEQLREMRAVVQEALDIARGRV